MNNNLVFLKINTMTSIERYLIYDMHKKSLKIIKFPGIRFESAVHT